MKTYRWLFLAVLVAGCRQGAAPPVKSSAVKIDSPRKKALRHVIEQPASIEGFKEAPLAARIPGYVGRVYVDIGKEVKGPRYDDKNRLLAAGTLLADLSVPEMLKEHAQKSALVKQARAEVEQAKAHLGEAEAKITRADATLERWESEFARVQDLFKSRVVERQILDETLSQYKSAKAARVETVAHRDKEKADVTVAEARVAVAEAEEERLKELIEYRFIYAPFDGVVTKRNIHPGHYLQPNASGGPGVLFYVAQIDKLRIGADVPETEAAYITENLEAFIHVPAVKDLKLKGKVARTSRTLDPKSRTLRVEIDFLNDEKKLRPGMYANLVFNIDLGERYTLPFSAIFTHADQPCCWRVDESGNAARLPLKLGLRSGPDVAVLEKKLGDAWQKIDGTEKIVVTNLGAVSEGKEVRIESK